MRIRFFGASSRPKVPDDLQATLALRLWVPVSLFVALVCVGTSGYYVLAHAAGRTRVTVRECLYQTSILLTGVGFSDILGSEQHWPLTAFTVVLCFLGLGILLYIVSTITAFVVSGELTDLLEKKSMRMRIEALRDHFVICGGGETGRHVVGEMLATRRPYVVVETSPEALEKLHHEHGADLCFLEADASDDETLRTAGIEHARGLIASLPNDKDNLLVVITARQLNPRLRIISRCIELENAKKLRLAGADAVVSPNMIGGLRMASEMTRPTVVSFLDTMLRDRRAIRFEEIRLPEGHPLVGKTLAEAGLASMADVNVVAAREAGRENFVYNPRGGLALRAGMDMVVIGSPEELEKLRKGLDL